MVYRDDVRVQGTFLIDLLKPAGRTLYTQQVQAVLNQANFSNVPTPANTHQLSSSITPGLWV